MMRLLCRETHIDFSYCLSIVITHTSRRCAAQHAADLSTYTHAALSYSITFNTLMYTIQMYKVCTHFVTAMTPAKTVINLARNMTARFHANGMFNASFTA